MPGQELPAGTIVFLTQSAGTVKLHLHPSIKPADFVKLIAPIVEEMRIEAVKSAIEGERRISVPDLGLVGGPNA